MNTAELLSRLEKVQGGNNGQYSARCPAHDDRGPSLSIKDNGDGRLLLHCFAGCETEDVLAAIGLGFVDVMPERTDHRIAPRGRPLPPLSLVLADLIHELTTAQIILERSWGCCAEDDVRLERAAELVSAGRRVVEKYQGRYS